MYEIRGKLSVVPNISTIYTKEMVDSGIYKNDIIDVQVACLSTAREEYNPTNDYLVEVIINPEFANNSNCADIINSSINGWNWTNPDTNQNWRVEINKSLRFIPEKILRNLREGDTFKYNTQLRVWTFRDDKVSYQADDSKVIVDSIPVSDFPEDDEEIIWRNPGVEFILEVSQATGPYSSFGDGLFENAVESTMKYWNDKKASSQCVDMYDKLMIFERLEKSKHPDEGYVSISEYKDDGHMPQIKLGTLLLLMDGKTEVSLIALNNSSPEKLDVCIYKGRTENLALGTGEGASLFCRYNVVSVDSGRDSILIYIDINNPEALPDYGY